MNYTTVTRDQVSDNGANAILHAVLAECAEQVNAELGNVVSMRVSVFNEILMRTWEKAKVLIPAAVLTASRKCGWFYDREEPNLKTLTVNDEEKTVDVKQVIGTRAENYRDGALLSASYQSDVSLVNADPHTSNVKLSYATPQRIIIETKLNEDTSNRQKVFESQLQAAMDSPEQKDAVKSNSSLERYQQENAMLRAQLALLQAQQLNQTPSLQVGIRQVALKALEQSHIRDSNQIVDRLIEVGLERKVKLPEEAPTDDESLATTFGRAMTKSVISRLENRKQERLVTKELAEEAKEKKAEAKAESLAEAKAISQPYLEKFSDGTLEVNAESLAARERKNGGGLKGDVLKALVRALGGNVKSTKLDNAKEFVGLFNAKQARERAVSDPLPAVDDTVMSTNLSKVLQPNWIPTIADFTSLQDAMFACVSHIIYCTEDTVYGGFIR